MSGIVFDSLGPDYPTFPQFQKALREYEAMLKRTDQINEQRHAEQEYQTARSAMLQNAYHAPQFTSPQPLEDGTISRIVKAMSESDDMVYTERAASPSAGDLFVIDQELVAAKFSAYKAGCFRVLRGQEGTRITTHAQWSNIVAVDTQKKA